jgi:monovalent cation:H+ antiporter-2, CPA2 family
MFEVVHTIAGFSGSSGLLLASMSTGSGSEQPLGLAMAMLFIAAALISAVCKKFNVEAIPGYLLAGAIIGPHALGLIRGEASVDQVSSLAVVLLMFTIGLHLDLSSMRRGMVHILAVGAASTVLTVGLIWSVLIVAGVPKPAALLLAMAASISSTAILVRILMSRRELHAVHGRVALGVSIVQDLASVVMLAAIPVIALWAGKSADIVPVGVASSLPGWSQKLISSVVAVSGVFVMLAGGQMVLPRVLQAVAKLQSQELVLVTSAALALASAVWTSYVGFSAEMGAFLAGFMLAATPFRFQLSGQMAPMRDLLMAIFFTSVGLRVNPMEVGGNLGAVALGFTAVLVVKFVVIGGSAYLAGMTASSACLLGVYTANAGEFSLVLIKAGESVLTPGQQGAAITVVILTLVATPLLVNPAQWLARKCARLPLSHWVRSGVLRDSLEHGGKGANEESHGATESMQTEVVTNMQNVEVGDATPLRRPRHVIIAGFGPVGRALADRFAVQGVDFTVVELNAATVKRQYTLGRRVVYGDITNREVLESARLHESDAVLLTIPDDESTMRACQVIRDAAPHVFLAARTNFLSGKFVALQLGADCVTVEEVATAQAMERDVLDGLSRWLEKRASGAPGRSV